MKISIQKMSNESRLTCTRNDGSVSSQRLGPKIPYHDIAHYVVESFFKMKEGFYGNIRAGRSIQELSDKAAIRKLGKESWLAEILTRNLQAMASGSCTENEFIDLVEWECKNLDIEAPVMDVEKMKQIKDDYKRLCSKWEGLREQDVLKLSFEVN